VPITPRLKTTCVPHQHIVGSAAAWVATHPEAAPDAKARSCNDRERDMMHRSRPRIEDDERRCDPISDPHSQPGLPPRHAQLHRRRHNHPSALSSSARAHHDLQAEDPRADVERVGNPAAARQRSSQGSKTRGTNKVTKLILPHVRFSGGTGRRSSFCADAWSQLCRVHNIVAGWCALRETAPRT
jgi:hypothetical protein